MLVLTQLSSLVMATPDNTAHRVWGVSQPRARERRKQVTRARGQSLRGERKIEASMVTRVVVTRSNLAHCHNSDLCRCFVCIAECSSYGKPASVRELQGCGPGKKKKTKRGKGATERSG